MARLLTTITMLAALAGCARPPPPGCATGLGAPMQVFTLYFGRSIPGRAELTDAEWPAFLDETVTRMLPNGYTVLDASGGWMNPSTRRTIRENTKVLVVALPDSPESLPSIEQVRRAYQTEFQQQLVGMTVEHACGTF